MYEKALRAWRVSGADPRGLHVWFDPNVEVLRLFHRQAGDPRDSDEGGLTAEEDPVTLDTMLSVSGTEDEDEDSINEGKRSGQALPGQILLPF